MIHIMKAIDSYLPPIMGLLRKHHLNLPIKREGDSLIVAGVRFSRINISTLQAEEKPGLGYLSPSLTEFEKSYCRKYGISYFAKDGHLYLVLKDDTIQITPRPKAKSKPSKITLTIKKAVAPTTLISPYAFAILDVLFRVPDQDLKSYSGLNFTNKFELDQPKLSIIMSSLRAENLPQLQNLVSEINSDWWGMALKYPATRKRMTPFFIFAQPFYSINDEPKSLAEIFKNDRQDIVPGPVEVAKGLGVIQDQNRYLWGTEAALAQLKKDLKLIPGLRPNKQTFYLAIPVEIGRAHV